MNGVKQLVPIPPVQETVTARPGSNRIQSDPTGSSRIQPDPAGSSRIQPDPTGSSPAHPSLHVAPPLLSPLPSLTTTTTTTTPTLPVIKRPLGQRLTKEYSANTLALPTLGMCVCVCVCERQGEKTTHVGLILAFNFPPIPCD